jgi:hypothetical protein
MKSYFLRITDFFKLFFYSWHFITLMSFFRISGILSLVILFIVSFYVPFDIIVYTPESMKGYFVGEAITFAPQGILLLAMLTLGVTLMIPQTYILTSMLLTVISGSSLGVFFRSVTFFLSGQENSIVFFHIFSLIRKYSAEFKLEEYKRVFYYSIDTSADFCAHKAAILTLVRDSYSFPSLFSLESLSLTEVKEQASSFAKLLYLEVLSSYSTIRF